MVYGKSTTIIQGQGVHGAGNICAELIATEIWNKKNADLMDIKTSWKGGKILDFVDDIGYDNFRYILPNGTKHPDIPTLTAIEQLQPEIDRLLADMIGNEYNMHCNIVNLGNQVFRLNVEKKNWMRTSSIF